MRTTFRLLVGFVGFARLADVALAQASDSTESGTRVSGALTVTNKGISLIPSFTLGRPAGIVDVSIARGGLSFDPQFRYGLDGKPWSFIFWGRYKLVQRERLQLSVGAHPAVLFSKTPLSASSTPGTILVARRYAAGELVPTYSLSPNANVGVYYLYSYGLDAGGTRNTHMVSLRSTLSSGKLSPRYVMRLTPQVYYLTTDMRVGSYLNAAVTVGRSDCPLSVAGAVNRAMHTTIVGETFLWNVSATWAIN